MPSTRGSETTNAEASHPNGFPPEHAIIRRFVLPASLAATFLDDLEDETEQPTPALRTLLRGEAAR